MLGGDFTSESIKIGDEVIKNNLFGEKDNQYLRDAIGDYLMVAVKNISINYDNSSPIFKANHAGFTNKELTVPLILIDTKNEDK